jgi:hypothetical protein
MISVNAARQATTTVRRTMKRVERSGDSSISWAVPVWFMAAFGCQTAAKRTGVAGAVDYFGNDPAITVNR